MFSTCYSPESYEKQSSRKKYSGTWVAERKIAPRGFLGYGNPRDGEFPKIGETDMRTNLTVLSVFLSVGSVYWLALTGPTTSAAQEASGVRGKAQGTQHTTNPSLGKVTGSEAVKGRISRINGKAHELIVTRSNGRAVRLVTNDTTQVRRGQRWLTLRDLRPGDLVLVVYNLDDGRNRAQIVNIE
jgi:hypothetical protein